MRKQTAVAFLCGILLCAPMTAQATVGLSTQFVDVVLEGLKIGASYDIRALKGVPYTVKNRGTSEVLVQVESIMPDGRGIPKPYEPIPDPTWIRLSPSEMRIAPGSVGFSDLMITIPEDQSLIGRHFYATLWAHTADTGLLAAGVRTRLRFSVGPGPATLAAEKLAKAMVTLNYDLWPQAMYIRKAKAGKKFDVKKRLRKSFKLTNRGDEKIELKFNAIPWPKSGGRGLPQGYEYIKDLSWVMFEPKSLKVKPNSVSDLQVVFDAPKKFKGRKFAFILQVQLPIGTPVSASHLVFVSFDK